MPFVRNSCELDSTMQSCLTRVENAQLCTSPLHCFFLYRLVTSLQRLQCNFTPQPIPRHTTTTTSFKARPQHHNTEPQLSTPSLFFPLQESLHAQLQTLLTQHILALRQHASLQRP